MTGEKTLIQLKRMFDEANDQLQWKVIVRDSGLVPLLNTKMNNVDHNIVAAFVERWHPETNSFHFSFGEMTITLHDVFYLTGLRVDGPLLKKDKSDAVLKNQIEDTWGFDGPQIVSWWKLSGLKIASLLAKLDEYKNNINNVEPHRVALLWLTIFYGVTIMLDESGSMMKHRCAVVFFDVEEPSEIAWGTCALAVLYRRLGESSRKGGERISGLTSLLQVSNNCSI